MSDLWFILVIAAVVVTSWAVDWEIRQLRNEVAELKLELKKIWERV